MFGMRNRLESISDLVEKLLEGGVIHLKFFSRKFLFSDISLFLFYKIVVFVSKLKQVGQMVVKRLLRFGLRRCFV